MKKFIIKICLLFVLLASVDLALGMVFGLYDFTKGGEINKVHTIMKNEVPDMVVMGSSRACHHFDPQVFSDSLNMTVYNAGIDGMGATVAYGFLNGLKHRKKPNIILFEITPEFDLLQGFPVSLDIFYPYIDNDSVKKPIIDFDYSEKWKLKSNAYRLNSTLFRLLPSIFLNREVHQDGYLPLSGTLSNIKDNMKRGKPTIHQVDSLKLQYLYKFLDEATKDGTLVFASISPNYGSVDHKSYDEEIKIVKEFGIPVFNHLSDTIFIKHSNLFQDKSHLNQKGASLYSRIIANEINNCIKDK